MDSLQPHRLLRLDLAEIIAHFKDLINKDPSPAHIDQISSHLRHFVHTQALPATIYFPWLHLALRHSPSLLPEALRDPVSYSIRGAAIQAVSQVFHNKEWKTKGWDVLGGAEGIAKIITSDLSLDEVKRVSKAIARCRHMGDRTTIASSIEELLRKLGARESSSSNRSLLLAVARLYPLCSEAFVADLLATFPETGSTTWLLSHQIAPLHTGLLRDIAVGRVSASQHVRKSVLDGCRKALVASPTGYNSVGYGHLDGVLPPGLLFCLDLYDILAEGDVEVDDHESYIKDCIRLAEKKHLPFQSILQFLQGLTTVAPKIWKTGLLRTTLALELLHCWSVVRFGSPGPKRVVMKRSMHPDHPSHPRSEHGDALESTLVKLLEQDQDTDLNPQKPRNGLMRLVKQCLKHVAPNARLSVLELLCRHSEYLFKGDGSGFSFDAKKSPPCDKERHILPRWDYDILQFLPAADGQVLFDRMLAIHACKDFVPVDDRQDGHLSLEQQCRLKTQWEAQGTEDFSVTRKCMFPSELAIDEHILTEAVLLGMKQDAEKQRDAYKRLQAAKAAVQVAADSTSLDLVHNAVQWTRRFLHDTTVFPGLIENAILGNEEVAAVLSGKLPASRQPKSASELQGFADKVNEVLRTLLEVLVLSLREPTVSDELDWSVYGFFNNFIKGRVDAVKLYRKAGLGTESEMGDILLMSLVPVMVEYERVALKDQEAHWHYLTMSLDYATVLRSLPAVAFLDRLTESVDAVYQKHRREKYPSVLELPEGHRGDSIDSLVRNRDFGACVLQNPETAPYTSNRLRQLLFHRVDVVTAPVPQGIKDIWTYADNMRFAVDSYLRSFHPKERKDALVSLWRYYSASANQYGDYLQLIRNFLFDFADNSELHTVQKIIHPPRLPEATYLEKVSPGSNEVMEWNPAPEEENTKGAKEHPVPLLYYMVRGNLDGDGFKLSPDTEETSIPVWGWSPIYKWKKETNMDLFRGLSVPKREAMLLSALLYLDTVTDDSNAKIGSTPFPNAESPRYPAIRLSDEFISKVSDLGPQTAVVIVRAYVKNAPAQVLRDLAMRFLDKIDKVPRTDPDYKQLFTCTVSLLKYVVLSDYPELAVDPILRVIENNPNDSTYHRELKLLTLGRRLRPEAAVSYLERFASFVCEALQEQQNRKGNDNNEDKPKRFVKVTTVKMLAQVIAQADFIPTSTSLDILKKVFHLSYQIDMRVEVVRATMAIFDRIAAGPAIEDTFRFFASLTFAAAGPSETETVTEADWAAAGETLPNVTPYKYRPLVWLFIKDVVYSLPARHRVTYVHNVLLPLVDESTNQHNRWMDAFLDRLGLSRKDPNINIPSFGPFHLEMVDIIMQYWTNYLPSSFLERYHRPWALGYLNNQAHDTITQALAAKDSGYRQTNAGQHWEEYLSQTRQADPLLRLTQTLTSDIDTQVEDGLTLAKVAEEYAYRAGVIARNPIAYNTDLRKYTISVDPLMKGLLQLRKRRNIPSGAKDRESKFVLLNGTLEGVVRDISSLRDQENWVKNPERKPAILPSPFELDIQLLPSSTASFFSSSEKEMLRGYIDGVVKLLRQCVGNPLSLLQFSDLEKDVRAGVAEKHAVAVATALAGSGTGANAGDESLETCLRVRLAKGVLQKLTVVERTLDAGVRDMIGKWRSSGSEFVRGMGWAIE